MARRVPFGSFSRRRSRTPVLLCRSGRRWEAHRLSLISAGLVPQPAEITTYVVGHRFSGVSFAHSKISFRRRAMGRPGTMVNLGCCEGARFVGIEPDVAANAET